MLIREPGKTAAAQEGMEWLRLTVGQCKGTGRREGGLGYVEMRLTRSFAPGASKKRVFDSTCICWSYVLYSGHFVRENGIRDVPDLDLFALFIKHFVRMLDR